MKIANYGAWESPLGADMLARGNVRIGFPAIEPDGALTYAELRSAEAGRTTVVRLLPDGTQQDLLPAPFSARSRVHEYGGRSHLVLSEGLLFVNQSDQQLWLKPDLGDPRQLTNVATLRFAEPILDRTRARILAIAEDHTAPDRVDNRLVAISLQDGAVRTLASGRTFYAAPALAPDGASIAFLAWDHPHMPWDAAQVCVAQIDEAGELETIRVIAGDASHSAFQPTWSPDGILYFSLEREGAWNLHRFVHDRVEPVTREPLAAELGAPLWQLGTHVFGFESARSAIGVCIERGVARIVRIELEDGRVSTLCPQLPQVAHLAVGDGIVICALGSGSELVRIDLASGALHRLRDVYAGWLGPLDTAEAESVCYPTSEGDLAYGFFYAPRNRGFAAPSGERPPLLVFVHGGPTASTAAIFSPQIQFWTTRGFAVLDVNYRGSTGYGRAYRDRLRGQWGVLDVADCVAGARYLAERGNVDPRRLLIRGGSAGGYTVLQALAEHDAFAAGACHYGISDLEALVRDTHKFESHYDRFLVGPYPERRDLFIARSPIHHVTRIQKPVIFFQGLDDRVVPADQTERMAQTLREHGIPTEYHAYAGEQHGFRKAETIQHVLETELAFFRRVTGAGPGPGPTET
jgi:dipeptidyl aminopeptidase/acylaminoacyl peptidase